MLACTAECRSQVSPRCPAGTWPGSLVCSCTAAPVPRQHTARLPGLFMKSQWPRPAMSILFMNSTMLVRLASCISAGFSGCMSLEANSSEYRRKSFPRRNEGRGLQCLFFADRDRRQCLCTQCGYLKMTCRESACGSPLGFG